MKRYDAVVFQDRTWWMIEIPELGTISQAVARSDVQSQARDLIALWLNVPENHVVPPRIRWSAPRHFDRISDDEEDSLSLEYPGALGTEHPLKFGGR